MKYVGRAYCSAHLPKILGVYELELHSAIEEACGLALSRNCRHRVRGRGTTPPDLPYVARTFRSSRSSSIKTPGNWPMSYTG